MWWPEEEERNPAGEFLSPFLVQLMLKLISSCTMSIPLQTMVFLLGVHDKNLYAGSVLFHSVPTS